MGAAWSSFAASSLKQCPPDPRRRLEDERTGSCLRRWPFAESGDSTEAAKAPLGSRLHTLRGSGLQPLLGRCRNDVAGVSRRWRARSATVSGLPFRFVSAPAATLRHGRPALDDAARPLGFLAASAVPPYHGRRDAASRLEAAGSPCSTRDDWYRLPRPARHFVVQCGASSPGGSPPSRRSTTCFSRYHRGALPKPQPSIKPHPTAVGASYRAISGRV